MDEKFYVCSRYGHEALDMVEYTEDLHQIMFADSVREFTIYGPDRKTPMGKVYQGQFYPDTRTYAEAAGHDVSRW